MAELDEGTVGIKVLAGLPDGNGLPSIAAELLETPRTVYGIVELRPHAEQHRLDTDSHTMSMRITQLEPLDGAAATALREQLVAVRQARTGVSPLPYDEADTPAQTGPAFPPPPAAGDVVDADGYVTPGPDGAGAQAAAEPVPAAAADTAPPAVQAPPFTPPTPIGSKTRARGAARS